MIAILPKQMWSLAYLLIADEWCEKEKEEKKILGDNYESLLLFCLEKKYLYNTKIFPKKKNEVGTIKLWSTTAPAKWIWIYFFLISKFNFSVEKVSLTF